MLLVALGLFAFGALLLWVSTIKLPDLESFETRKVRQTTKIYDRTGEVLLFDLFENIQRTVVPFEDISRHIKNAAVAIEDAEFYQHSGVKPTAFLRAVLANIREGRFSQGGSTITQQVIKNSVLTTDKTITRKLREWVLALRLEQTLTKEEILALYLNETPYGGTLYGVEEASRAYFDKSAADVTLPEAAYLAALPQAPTFYSPYGSHRFELEVRKNLVLEKMLENGFISKEEYEEAKDAAVEFEPDRNTGIRAPHFVFFVREYLEETYGKRAIEERGFRVITTLDADLQQEAEEIVRRNALENETDFNAENAAMTAIDPKTGEILVMVGSRGYSDPDIDGNFNAATAPNRQPGSAFKPFVYAEALRKGYTPETAVFDLKTQFSTACAAGDPSNESPCFSPSNYDDVFRGPITFKDALAQSVNIPAVKVLYLAGLPDSIALARAMGIGSLEDANRYGLTLVLGSGEVSLLDMTSAYGVFAHEGVRSEPAAILRIEDGNGNIVEEHEPRGTRVLERDVAAQISDMLSDNAARTPAFGANSALYFPGRDVAAKTGTTNEYRDAWIIGYTPDIAVGSWAGNNDSSSMEKRVAGFIVAPMWNEFMQYALSRTPANNFPEPPEPDNSLKPVLRGIWQGGETAVIDTRSRKLATERTPAENRAEAAIPDVHSILHWVDRGDPRGAYPANPNRDGQFPRWEYAVAAWRAGQEALAGIVTLDALPTEFGGASGGHDGADVRITSPRAGDTVSIDAEVAVTVSIGRSFEAERMDVHINGAKRGTTGSAPFSFSFTPSMLGLSPGEHTLAVTVRDGDGEKVSAETTFFVKE